MSNLLGRGRSSPLLPSRGYAPVLIPTTSNMTSKYDDLWHHNLQLHFTYTRTFMRPKYPAQCKEIILSMCLALIETIKHEIINKRLIAWESKKYCSESPTQMHPWQTWFIRALCTVLCSTPQNGRRDRTFHISVSILLLLLEQYLTIAMLKSEGSPYLF